MPNELDVIDRRHSALAPTENHADPLLTVMDKLANNPNLDADKIERIMNVFIDGQRKMATMADERAFAEAMADFKKNPPQIIKSRLAEMVKEGRKLYEYNFADLDAYTQAAMAPLAERGITWSFPFSEAGGQITVSCILRYGLFEATPTTMSAAPDATGGKNAIQAKASTISYLERYTFCGATGLTAAMPDQDGRSGEAGEAISQSEGADWVAKIEEAATPAEAMESWTKAMSPAIHINDYKAQTIYTAARDKRLKELKRGSR